MLCYCHAIGRHSKEVVVIPEREPMIKIATTLEQAVDDHGWDKPPVLGDVLRVNDGFHSKPFSIQPSQVDPGDPVGALIGIADGMMKVTDQHRRLSAALGVTGAADANAGLWFICEAELRDRVARGAWQKCRICVLVDCGGWIHEVIRPEGEPPEIRTYEPHHPDIDSDIVDGLRRMLLAMGTGMSSGMIDMEKVGMAGVAGS
jgi:hypothetical protein